MQRDLSSHQATGAGEGEVNGVTIVKVKSTGRMFPHRDMRHIIRQEGRQSPLVRQVLYSIMPIHTEEWRFFKSERRLRVRCQE